MTYRELKAHIEVMDGMQLEQDVTIHLKESDEFLPVEDIGFANEEDETIEVMDICHPFLVIDF